MTQVYVPRRAARAESLVLRGLKHRLTRWGPAEVEPIVLLHGWMDAGESWQLLVDRLPDTWSFVALDWRGFGGSERARDGYWFADYYGDLDALLDAILPGRAARVIGHSMGGNVACMYAGIRPERLAWLVNLEGLGLPSTTPDQAPERYAEWLDLLREPVTPRTYSSLERFTAAVLVRNPRLERETAAFLARVWTRPLPEGGVELNADPLHLRPGALLYRRDEAEACWRRIRCPLLLVTGGESELRSRLGHHASDEYLASIVSGARHISIAGAGHMLHHECPDETARHIVEFANAAQPGASCAKQ